MGKTRCLKKLPEHLHKHLRLNTENWKISAGKQPTINSLLPKLKSTSQYKNTEQARIIIPFELLSVSEKSLKLYQHTYI